MNRHRSRDYPLATTMRAFLFSFRGDRDKTGGGLRYCAVNHNSRSFIQFRPLACIRAAWNRRSQPEISRIVLVKSLKFHVYSIRRDALPARVLSRACQIRWKAIFGVRILFLFLSSLSCRANQARLLLFGHRPGTDRHFNQYRGDSCAILVGIVKSSFSVDNKIKMNHFFSMIFFIASQFSITYAAFFLVDFVISLRVNFRNFDI